MNLADELKKIVKGEVKTDAKTLDKFSHDASMFEVRPEVVVAPKDVADIKKLVKYSSEHEEVSLTPSAGRSGMSGGSLTESVVIDFTKHINKLKKIGSDSATVQPGMYYRDFEKETLKHELFMPSFPASRELCAIGGMVGNNAGGEKTLAYGKTEDFIRSLKVVLYDSNEYEFRALGKQELEEKMALENFEGEVYRKIYKLINSNYETIKKAKPKVSKNSAGYYLWNIWDKQTGIFDLTKLFVGSQGTLGIITEVNFRLVKPKPKSRMLVVFLRDLKQLPVVVNTILAENPETIETYDNHTLSLAFRFLPEFVKLLKGNIFSLALKFLPEVRMILTGGMPKLVLTAEFTGEAQDEINNRIQKIRKTLKQFDVKNRATKSDQEAAKYRVIRRESFNLLRHKIHDKQTVPFIDDIIVRPEKLPEFLPKLIAALDEYEAKYDFIYTIAGHAGSGNFHIIPLMNLADPNAIKIIRELGPRVYRLVLDYEGSITAEHNDGLVRSPYLKDMYGERVYKLFEEVKEIFDPKGIFNPGKKVGSSLDYALEHIKGK